VSAAREAPQTATNVHASTSRWIRRPGVSPEDRPDAVLLRTVFELLHTMESRFPARAGNTSVGRRLHLSRVQMHPNFLPAPAI